ncbi:cysteine-rich venom protein TEL1 isoform X2 [Balearica regulorum gibbericeps]|uniref:cysteine-rich venom protein TEL1 isoform X2 n=1 Tax=Balearica regulorum gibbericeps TaxID=100784 RepID=UPI003F5FE3C0
MEKSIGKIPPWLPQCQSGATSTDRKQKTYKSPSDEELQSLPQPPEEGRKKLLIFLETKEMILPVVFLCLTAVLPLSTGEELENVNVLPTSKANEQKLIVDKHNSLRRGVKPTASNMMKMEWCPPAAKNAKNWANKCTLRHSPANMRRTTVQCGENLFMSSAPLSWSDVIQAWYNEEKDFQYGTGAKRQGAVVGHYTQVVWYNSYQIGCAVAFCPNSIYKYFYVCQYCPAGNLLNSIQTPYKKGKPCGDCPNACENGLCTKL